ncbi:MAG: hypothetical protein AB1791_14200 [Chloroflexota bacterium]
MSKQATSDHEAEREARLSRLLREKPDEIACQNCLAQLDDYVAAQLAGRDYLAAFSNVAYHLDACLECAAVYARLYELELAAAGGRLAAVMHIPAPNLSVLLSGRSRFQRDGSSWKRDLQESVQRMGDWLRLQLSADLLPLLHPTPTLAALRAPADSERYAETLLNLEPDEALRPDWPATVTAYRDSHHPEECLIEVMVELPGRSWPDLAGIPVILVTAGQRREALTDAWGLSAFAGVPVSHLPDLTIEIRTPSA